MSTQSGGVIPHFTVADRLRKAREAAGLDQTGLARRMGVSRGTISNTERGVVSVRRPMVGAWSLATGVPVSWIETGEDPSQIGDESSPGELAGGTMPSHSLRGVPAAWESCAA